MKGVTSGRARRAEPSGQRVDGPGHDHDEDAGHAQAVHQMGQFEAGAEHPMALRRPEGVAGHHREEQVVDEPRAPMVSAVDQPLERFLRKQHTGRMRRGLIPQRIVEVPLPEHTDQADHHVQADGLQQQLVGVHIGLHDRHVDHQQVHQKLQRGQQTEQPQPAAGGAAPPPQPRQDHQHKSGSEQPQADAIEQYQGRQVQLELPHGKDRDVGEINEKPMAQQPINQRRHHEGPQEGGGRAGRRINQSKGPRAPAAPGPAGSAPAADRAKAPGAGPDAGKDPGAAAAAPPAAGPRSAAARSSRRRAAGGRCAAAG